jgi:osmotically-inducible protein OsmY
MHENYRENFGPRRYEDERDDRDQRWRQEEDRYRREAMSRNRFDDDRYDIPQRRRNFGYGQAFRDDDYAGNHRYGTEREHGHSPGWRDDGRYDDRQHGHSHHDHSYGRAGRYPGSGDSRYFTGQQGSWALGQPNPNPAYGYGGYGGFGDDYRSHGYDRDRGEDHRGFFDKAGDEIASWFGDEDAARRREMDHRGRGPKDYVRSDERIRDDANDRLTDDWRLDASDVTVRVENGEVTLDGTVPDRMSKRRAEDLVEDISGVKHVQNNLRVAQRDYGDQNRATSDAGGMISDPHQTAQPGAPRATEKA